MVNIWYLGDLPKVTAIFTDDTGVLVDPTTITAKVKKPDKTVTTLVFGVDAALVRDGVGIYHIYIDLTQSGNWFYRFSGTGVRQVAREGTIFVEPTNF